MAGERDLLQETCLQKTERTRRNKRRERGGAAARATAMTLRGLAVAVLLLTPAVATAPGTVKSSLTLNVNGAPSSCVDVDGDGIDDLLIGQANDNDGGVGRGAFSTLFLNANFSIRGVSKVSDTQGSFNAVLENEDYFGASPISVGDLDGDAVPDVAVGAFDDDDGGLNKGAVYVIFMKNDGTVKSFQKISDTQGGFSAPLGTWNRMGKSVQPIGDFNGDSVTDIAVGCHRCGAGAVFLLYLNVDGTVNGWSRINPPTSTRTFGDSVASLGDLDGDQVTDIAVGAAQDSDGGARRGAAFIFLMNSDGTVKSYEKVSNTYFMNSLVDYGYFGSSMAQLNDVDGDRVVDLAVAASGDDDGGESRGAVFILLLRSNGSVKDYRKISSLSNPELNLSDNYGFGAGIANVGDRNGDCVADIAVGCTWGCNTVHILLLNGVNSSELCNRSLQPPGTTGSNPATSAATSVATTATTGPISGTSSTASIIGTTGSNPATSAATSVATTATTGPISGTSSTASIIVVVCIGLAIAGYFVWRRRRSTHGFTPIPALDAADVLEDCGASSKLMEPEHELIEVESTGSSSASDEVETIPLDDVDEADACTVCMTAKIDSTFVPCGHYSCCGRCAKKCQKHGACPICRQPIESVVKTFRS